jgi:phosphopantothenoylcysteine synthetase/decarboxylase
MSDFLALVVGGAPLAARADEVAAAAVAVGWQVRVIATADAAGWVDQARVEAVTGAPVLTRQRRPDQPKRFPTPAAVLACPATFNTVNKLAAGIMDNYPSGVLCEALASGTRLVLVPMVSTRLWGHPVWAPNLALLAGAGVRFVDARTGRLGPPGPSEAGLADDVVAGFDPAWPVAAAGPSS